MELQIIQNKIYEIRGQRVMLDFDLAELYGVPTKALKQAVRRNIERFEGEDFMFELTEIEYNRLIVSLRSQIVTSNERGGRRYLPLAFTEIGVSMLSSVLRSETAIYVNRTIMRAFVAMRNYLATTTAMTVEMKDMRETLEETMEAVNELSQQTREENCAIWDAITALSEKPSPPEKPRVPIGYPTAGTIKNEL